MVGREETNRGDNRSWDLRPWRPTCFAQAEPVSMYPVGPLEKTKPAVPRRGIFLLHRKLGGSGQWSLGGGRTVDYRASLPSVSRYERERRLLICSLWNFLWSDLASEGSLKPVTTEIRQFCLRNLQRNLIFVVARHFVRPVFLELFKTSNARYGCSRRDCASLEHLDAFFDGWTTKSFLYFPSGAGSYFASGVHFNSWRELLPPAA